MFGTRRLRIVKMTSLPMHHSLMLTVILWTASSEPPPCKISNRTCGCEQFSKISRSLRDSTGSTVKALATSKDTDYYYINDMIFNTSRLATDQGRASSQKEASAALSIKYWSGGIIFYLIDDNFDEEYRKIILKALDTIELAVGKEHLEFKNVQTKSGKICRNLYLKIELTKVAGECKSEIGMNPIDNITRIWLNQDHCKYGNVIHEVLHALGRQHEHVRPDRDAYVNIRYMELQTTSCSNYEVMGNSSSVDPTLLEAYELGSIMHYGSCYFSCRGEYTLLSKNGSKVTPNRNRLTDLDAKKMRRLYPADAKVAYDDSMCKRGGALLRSSGGDFPLILLLLGLSLVGFLA